MFVCLNLIKNEHRYRLDVVHARTIILVSTCRLYWQPPLRLFELVCLPHHKPRKFQKPNIKCQVTLCCLFVFFCFFIKIKKKLFSIIAKATCYFLFIDYVFHLCYSQKNTGYPSKPQPQWALLIALFFCLFDLFVCFWWIVFAESAFHVSDMVCINKRHENLMDPCFEFICRLGSEGLETLDVFITEGNFNLRPLQSFSSWLTVD